MRWLPSVLAVLVAASTAGCETRPPCEVVCSNQVRCRFSPEMTACVSMCNASFAMSTMDCRVATDSYNRCWSNAGSCPASPSIAAPGCASEYNQMVLACTRSMPLLERPLLEPPLLEPGAPSGI